MQDENARNVEAAPRRAEEEDLDERREELVGRLKAGHVANEEFAKVIAENWQRVAVAVAIAALGVWLVSLYRESRERAIGEASARFSSAQKALTVLQAGTLSEEQRKSTARAFEDNLSALEEGYRRTIYARLARVYRAAETLRSGDATRALADLGTVDRTPFLAATAVVKPPALTADRFVQELGALVAARALAAQNDAQGKELLRGLVYAGNFANLEALNALLGLAASAAELEKAGELGRSLAAGRPEFRDQLESLLSTWGVNSGESAKRADGLSH